jgi:hypothetical protein
MIKNNKGTILVVAVTAMVVMIIIGFVCLQMYMNQSILDTYDVTKKRLFYSAEGAIEIFRGYINVHRGAIANDVAYGYLYNNSKVNNSGDGSNITSANAWTPLPSGALSPFDGTMHPPITVTVGLRRLTELSATKNPELKYLLDGNAFGTAGNTFRTAITAGGLPTSDRAYEIIARATATHNTALIGRNSNRNVMSVTLHYYFYTHHQGTDAAANNQHVPTFVGWRIEN